MCWVDWEVLSDRKGYLSLKIFAMESMYSSSL